MKKIKKTRRKNLKKSSKKFTGRGPSNKNKSSKIKKLIRLAKLRVRKGESKKSSSNLGNLLKRLHKKIK